MIDKKRLKEYSDISEEIKKIEKKIERLEKQEKNICDSVTGSSPLFPYTEQHIKIYGTDIKRVKSLDKYHNLLEKRKTKLLDIKIEIETFIDSITTSRLRRIFEYRYLDNLSWQKVAELIGKDATADSVRVEHDRFFQKK